MENGTSARPPAALSVYYTCDREQESVSLCLLLALATDIVLQQNVGSCGKSGSGVTKRKSNEPADSEKLNPREPVEALLAPERLGEAVGHLDGLDPLGVLVAEPGRGAQPQRIAERIALPPPRPRYGCEVAVVVPQDKTWDNDPFAASPDYRFAENRDGRWRIYLRTK